MTESWFSSMSRDSLELFRGISNQPFPELHCSALKVFTVGISSPRVLLWLPAQHRALEWASLSVHTAVSTLLLQGPLRETCADGLSVRGIQYCLRFKQAALDHRLTQLLTFSCSALALTPTFPSGTWCSSDARLLASHLWPLLWLVTSSLCWLCLWTNYLFKK